jgi:hypothetical protein
MHGDSGSEQYGGVMSAIDVRIRHSFSPGNCFPGFALVARAVK